MSMLDSFFNKGFKGAKCKTLLKLTIPRIKLLRNRREIQLKQMRKDIAKLLENGQEATARIRVEHIIREENTMAAQEIIELFCELISVRLPIIETQRECPLDLKEAISSICFAAPRCADLPELLQVQMLFGAKYGKEFISAATELMPDCGVNRQIIELLSVRAPSAEKKLKLLKEIAEEHDLEWDPAASETEFFKPHEDLLNGPTQFVSGSQLALPKEKHDESLHSAPVEASHEQSDSDSELDSLNFPEVPKVSLQPSSTVSAPEMFPPPNQTSPDTGLGNELNNRSSENRENIVHEPYLEMLHMPESAVSSVLGSANTVDGRREEKQYLPFISAPSLSSASFCIRQNEPVASLSRTKSEIKSESVDLQDVLAAAHAAAESAERAAAAARSAASLAQLRISELTKRKNGQSPEGSEHSSCRNIPDQSTTPEVPRFDHQQSFGNTDQGSYSSDPRPDRESISRSESLNPPTYDSPKGGFESPPLSNNGLEHESTRHQPQRLSSLDEDPYYSYPNLFKSQSFNQASAIHRSADNSPTTRDV